MTVAKRAAPAAGVEIFFIDLNAAQSALEAEEAVLPRLSDDEEQRAANFENRHDGRLWRACRIALRIVLERWAGPSVGRQPFTIDANGRPSLAGGAPQFSISHSGGLALIGLSGASTIGVDVETARMLRMSSERQARIIEAARAYNPVDGAEQPADPGRALQSWVRLEAVAKASGSGIGRVLTAAGVIGGVGRRGDGSMPSAFEVRDLDIGAGVYGAVAAQKLPARIEVRRFPLDAGGVAALKAETIG